MRAYFMILFGLLFLATFVSYKIAATLPFDRSGNQTSLHSPLVSNDNGTSACFEKRYSPQIRDCGGLLKYGAPTLSYRVDSLPKQQLTLKRRRSRGRLPTPEPSTKVTLGKSRHPSVPSHSDMANFQ